jgi:hypothetical protein
MKEAGMTPPPNYQTWVELDQIDALRSGLVLDPITKKWQQRNDIRFPNMRAAYLHYKDITGKNLDEIRKAKVAGADELAQAINKRDAGVVQMDASRSTTEGEGTAVSEEQARTLLETVDIADVAQQVLIGNMEPLNQVNQARVRLGLPAFDPSEFQR